MRRLLFVLMAILVTASALAEVDRTLYTRENRFPDLYRPELNLIYNYTELGNDNRIIPKNDADIETYSLMGRVQVLPDLTINADLPYKRYTSDTSSDHSGLGDITVGASLLAYEHILDYPFVIPHVDHTFDTGDEDENLGAGEEYTTIGIGIGTVTRDVLHWMLDLGYEIRDKSDNAVVIGGSLVWDLDERFSVLAETQYRQAPDHAPNADSYGILYTGGMVYQANDVLTFSAYGTGAAKNTDEDVGVTLRATISF